MKTKKLISVICALSMAGSIMSGAVIANAEDTTGSTTDTEVTATEAATEEATVDPLEAFNNAIQTTGGDYTLTADVPLVSSAITKDVAVDGAGYSFTSNSTVAGALLYQDEAVTSSFSNVTFAGGTKEDIGISHNAGTMTISDATVKDFNITNGRMSAIGVASATMNLNNVTFTNNANYDLEIHSDSAVVNLSGTTSLSKVYMNWWRGKVNIANDCEAAFEITFGNGFERWCTDEALIIGTIGGADISKFSITHAGYNVIEENGYLMVVTDAYLEKDYVAEIASNGYKYRSLDTAVNAAEAGDTINLLADATKSTATDGEAVTINGNGKTITLTNVSNNAFNNLTIKNAKIARADEATSFNIALNATFENVTIDGLSGDCLFLDGAIIKGSNINGYNGVAVLANNAGNNSTILIENSTITNTKLISTNGVLCAAIRVWGNQSAVIDNSTLTGTTHTTEGTLVHDVIADIGGIVELKNNTNIGSLFANNKWCTIILDETFTGNVNIFTQDPAVGWQVAKVEEGADVSGVKVTDLPEDRTLAVINGYLTVCDATIEKNIEAANWAVVSGEDYTASGNVLTRVSDGDVVYGYKAEVTGNGVTFTNIKATVQNTEGEVQTKKFDCTVSGTAEVVFYIISGAELDTTASKVILN